MRGIDGPGKFYAKECDVSKEDDVIEVVAYIKKSFGALHILVNNAGMIRMKSIEGK